MILFNNERLLDESKSKWKSGDNQRFEDMTISDVENHKDVIRKKINVMMQEVDAGEVSNTEDHLFNIKKMRQNRVYLILLSKKANDLQEKK